MQLRRLAGLERQKIEDEYLELPKQIAYYESLLADPTLILGVIRDEVLALKERFADARRTEIVRGSGRGLLRRRPDPAGVRADQRHAGQLHQAHAADCVSRSEARAAAGVQGMRTKDEDVVVDLLAARTLDHMLFFTDRGRVYSQRVFNLPDTARDGRGLPMVNFLNLTPDERVTAILVVPDFEQAKYVTLLTRRGKIKRMQLSGVSRRAAERHHRDEPRAGRRAALGALDAGQR